MNDEIHRRIRRHIKALCSILGLFDVKADAEFWDRTRVRLADLVDRAATTETEHQLRRHIRSFAPTIIYRRDPGLWESAIYCSDSDGQILALHFDASESISLFALGHHFPREKSFFLRRPNVLDQFREAVRTGAIGSVGQKKYFALWVNRGYDTLLRISQIRVLREHLHSEFAPKLAMRTRGNLFEAADVLPFIRDVEKISEPAAWREKLGLQTQLIEFIEIPGELDLDYHPNMIALIREMAACDSPFLDAKTAGPSIVLLVSLDFEKRQFMGQEGLIERLIFYFSLRGKPIILVVNGMTGMVDAPDEFPQVGAAESRIIRRIASRFPDLKVIHMHDRTFVEKAALYKHADFFLAPLGNATLIPLALDLPGIILGPPVLLREIGWMCQRIPSRATIIDPTWSTVVDNDAALVKYDWGHDDGSRSSYNIDSEKLFSLARRQSDQALTRKFSDWNTLA